MMDNDIEVHFLANKKFFDLINTIMGTNQEPLSNFEHIKCALELYASVIQSIEEGHTPVMMEKDNMHSHAMPLPENLQKYYEIQNPQPHVKFNFRKSIL